MTKNRLAMTALYTSVAAAALAIGGVIPLMSLSLEAMGYSATIVGSNASIAAAAIICTGFLTPFALRKFGAMPSVIWGTAMGGTFMILIGLTENLAAWMVLRFLVGLTTAILWVVTEIWVNRLATEKNRGLLLGGYSALFGLGFAAGPVIVGQFHPLSPVPYMIVSGVLFLALIPLILAREALPKAAPNDSGLSVRLIKLAPVVFLAALASGATEMSTFALLPLFGLMKGYDGQTSLLMVSAFATGNVLMQIPIGWFADRHGRLLTTGLCAGGTALASVALPWVMDSPVIAWPLLVFWGGVGFGIYTSGLGLMGQKFKPEDIAAGNAMFIIFYMTGGLIAPLLGGMATDILGPPGATSMQALAGALLVIVVLVSRKR